MMPVWANEIMFNKKNRSVRIFFCMTRIDIVS
jgi:hypothetical protein